MEKKVIRVVFDNDLNAKFENDETLRLGSSRSVEMWFRFEKPLANATYRLNALLPNKESVFEQLADIVQENDYVWYVWKIDEAYTGNKGKLMVAVSAYTDNESEMIFVTAPIDIYCEFSVKGNSNVVFIQPSDYELLLYSMSKKGDLDIYGKLLDTQMPDTYQQMKDDIETIKERLQTIMTLLTKE